MSTVTCPSRSPIAAAASGSRISSTSCTSTKWFPEAHGAELIPAPVARTLRHPCRIPARQAAPGFCVLDVRLQPHPLSLPDQVGAPLRQHAVQLGVRKPQRTVLARAGGDAARKLVHERLGPFRQPACQRRGQQPDAAVGDDDALGGGLTDLLFQRFIEIWSSIPVLYLLLIVAAVLPPASSSCSG